MLSFFFLVERKFANGLEGFAELRVELRQTLAGLGLWLAACQDADHRQALK